MKFKCQACGQVLYFENTRCERCSRQLGYSSKTATLSALEPENESWRTFTKPRRLVRFCENAAHDVCNWLMDEGSVGTPCAAYCHNHTIFDLAIGDNLRRWRRLELAKHWLFYALQRLRLPLQTRLNDPEHGLALNFLADSSSAMGNQDLYPFVLSPAVIAKLSFVHDVVHSKRTLQSAPVRSPNLLR